METNIESSKEYFDEPDRRFILEAKLLISLGESFKQGFLLKENVHGGSFIHLANFERDSNTGEVIAKYESDYAKWLLSNLSSKIEKLLNKTYNYLIIEAINCKIFAFIPI